MWMRALLFALLVLSVSICGSASAGSVPDDRTYDRFCRAVGGLDVGASNFKVMDETLDVLAGVTSADTDESSQKKVADLWRRSATAAATSKQSLNCGSSVHLSGTVMKLAAERLDSIFIETLVLRGADINQLDRRTNRTALDDVLLHAEDMLRSTLPWTPPAGRQSQLSFHDHARSRYLRMREMGALHSHELASRTTREQREASCLAIPPGAASGPVAEDYPGGLASKMSALTPATAPGARTVSAKQAACLIRSLGNDITVIAPMRESLGLPRALRFPFLASAGSFDDEVQTAARELVRMLGPDESILVYCQSESCFRSYNAAARLAHAGNRRVYWMREGTRGWRESGYPLSYAGGVVEGGQ